MLTPKAAVELGKQLRFLRNAQSLTLRDVAKAAGLSAQYVQNIERGERSQTSDEAYRKLAAGYAVPPQLVNDLVLKFRLISLLEEYGLDAAQQTFVWTGVEQRMAEVGYDLRVDLAKFISDLLTKR